MKSRREKWKDCFIYPEAYEVSNHGRVRSKDILVKNSRNDSLKSRRGRVLALSYNKAGYLKCQLSYKGSEKTYMVHRLVAYSFFCGDPGLTVNHKNGVKTDNRLHNLELVTHKENLAHAKRMGLCKHARGSEAGKATIDEKKAATIKNLRNSGEMYKTMAEKTGASVKVVGDICRGRTWKHVTTETSPKSERF